MMIDSTHLQPESEPKPILADSLNHSEWYYKPEGDLEILSSDGILLKMAAYSVSRAHSAMEKADEISPKFGEMLKVGKQGGYERIILTDPELETASVFHGLFDVMIKNADILDLCLQGTHSPTRRQLVIRLAQKYDFKRELHSIHQDLRLGLYVNKRNPWNVFELAIRIDDLDLCVDAVKKASTWVKEDQACTRGEEKFGDPLQGGGLFDIRTYSLESLKGLPIEVV
jgi:hypothetical protein